MSSSGNSPITELDVTGEDEVSGMGVGAGLGAELQGSRPSSYTEFARGFSSTKLPPIPLVDVEIYL